MQRRSLKGLGKQMIRIKYELKRMASLALLAVFGLILFLLRGSILGTRMYLFILGWNLFLALIPYGIAFVMLLISSYKHSKWWSMSLLPLGALWLLFYPNAPYMLTSYAHFHWVLAQPYGVLFVLQPWYDLILFTSVIWCAVLTGFASLTIIHSIVIKHFGRVSGWIVIAVISFLSSWAIYLGRFIRLNSWYVFTNPGIVLPYIRLCGEKMIFVFFLGVFLMLAYICVYFFSGRDIKKPNIC